MLDKKRYREWWVMNGTLATFGTMLIFFVTGIYFGLRQWFGAAAMMIFASGVAIYVINPDHEKASDSLAGFLATLGIILFIALFWGAS